MIRNARALNRAMLLRSRIAGFVEFFGVHDHQSDAAMLKHLRLAYGIRLSSRALRRHREWLRSAENRQILVAWRITMAQAAERAISKTATSRRLIAAPAPLQVAA